MSGSTIAMILVIAGGLIYKLTDAERTFLETDLHLAVPTEWWAFIAYGQAILFALLACTNGTIANLIGAQGQGLSCPDAILAGLGFGTVAMFIQKFKPSGNITAPKGFTRSTAAPKENPA